MLALADVGEAVSADFGQERGGALFDLFLLLRGEAELFLEVVPVDGESPSGDGRTAMPPARTRAATCANSPKTM
ncbi:MULTISPECIES: hypothetical protein [unclassified Streptomyces]|uniref:hypothetical protein n=1 Tax=unclassified Streptomyces TaxID=2593676 RepID=UPI00117DF746|nr:MULTISPECIES: hypothetical protein [unclassified Streptomyces]TRO69250.1 hypothetical protein E4K73_00815 [Streptomyces sp. IB201691-2A2]